MYFYVVEALRNKTAAREQAKLKDDLLRLGIAGEMVTTNPLRSAHELVHLGLQKGYSTIVAVGDDRHVSEVATTLVGTGVALGVLPIQASSALISLLGVSSWKEALQGLRMRKLRSVTVGEIIRGPVFLTHASLASRLPTLFQVIFDGFAATVQTKEVVIATIHPETGEVRPGQLFVLFRGVKPEQGMLHKLFGSAPEEAWTSHFSSEAVRIQTRDPHPVLVGEEKIFQTPAVFRALPDRLRLIVGKRGVDEPGPIDSLANQAESTPVPVLSQPRPPKPRMWGPPVD